MLVLNISKSYKDALPPSKSIVKHLSINTSVTSRERVIFPVSREAAEGLRLSVIMRKMR